MGEEKRGKSGGKDIEKQENASSHMSVEQGGKGLKWWGVCRMRVNGRLCVCVEGRGLMQITSEAAAQMLRKLPALGALRVLSHDARRVVASRLTLAWLSIHLSLAFFALPMHILTFI